jgi:hypothetical protein
MPTECIADLFGFEPVGGRRVEAAFDGGRLTSDAGGLLLGRTSRAIGLIDRFAKCFDDHRKPGQIEHEVATLVGQRVYGIVLGYEDLVDHDHLRHDPVLAALGGKLEARRSTGVSGILCAGEPWLTLGRRPRDAYQARTS